MTQQRVATIRVPLTEEQRAFIKSVTGAEVTEAVFAAPVTTAATLENELTGEADRALGEAVWASNADFLRRMDAAYAIKRAFEDHIGHTLDPKTPNVAMLR